MNDQSRAAAKVQLEGLKAAARAYVDATERGEGERLSGIETAARLRLAAKDFVRAERAAKVDTSARKA